MINQFKTPSHVSCMENSRFFDLRVKSIHRDRQSIRGVDVLALKQSGFSSFDNLDGSVLKRGPRVFGMEPTKKREYVKAGEALFDAVKEGDIDMVRELCTTGINGFKADPDYSDEFGFSCLHLAAKVNEHQFRSSRAASEVDTTARQLGNGRLVGVVRRRCEYMR